MSEATANIWRADYDVRSYEVDAGGRLSVPTLFNLLQDAASSHAEALGVSVHHLQRERLTWVLSRMRLTVGRYPRWRDRLQVRTWPSGGNRLFAFRQFSIDCAGEGRIAAASSAWLIIDTASRRPVRIAPFIQRLRPETDLPGLADPLDKLPALASADGERCFHVRYRDLDINQHVNNVSYIEWALESLPRERLTADVPADLEINFLGEAFLDDGIVAQWQPMDATPAVFSHQLRHEATGRELARLRSTWRSAPCGQPSCGP